ncbi:MAG: hypothetical protein GXO83_00750 [Chlorobi bacterium]|nr:hypothetical protein [Chlorobiota bacterium]
MKILIIINDGPYGTEKAYNALRLANQILRDHKGIELTVFLMADAAGCALENQKTPDGYYNIGRFIKSVIRKGGSVKICTACAEARGLDNATLIEGTTLSTMAELATLTVDSRKVITF